MSACELCGQPRSPLYPQSPFCLSCRYLRQQTRIKQRAATRESRFARYKHDASRRQLVFELTFAEFCVLWQHPCYYCGSDIDTIGLDRIDNTQGYTLGNVVSCCTTCNRMKTNLTIEVFLTQCKRIRDNHDLINIDV